VNGLALDGEHICRRVAMMKQTEQTRFGATIALLRGVVLLVAGLVALFAPTTALTVIVVVGGCLLVVDGVLGVVSQDYGADREWPFWLSLARSILAIVAGAAILLSPYLATIITLGVLSTLVGLQAVAIGLIEIVIIVRDRKQHKSIWRAVAAAGLYVALGLLLLFIPFAGAVLLIQIGGAIVILFALLQLVQTWTAIRTSPGFRPLS
jgi:uncharacterized membrane protein HdeD (DUF308 family)